MNFHPSVENHPQANGDYYFDKSIAYVSQANTIYIPTIGSSLPYHHKMEAGKEPPNADCILIIGEPSTSNSGAVEIPECTFAPSGAVKSFNSYVNLR